MTKRLPHSLTEIRRDWPVLSLYQRFEASVAFILTLIITVIIAVGQIVVVAAR
jgi:hypothetical protein